MLKRLAALAVVLCATALPASAGQYNIVKQIGNYGDSFERNVGKSTPLKFERDLNAVWINGGLIYAIPFR